MSDAATTETDLRDLKISEQAEGIAALTKVEAKSSKKPVFTENYSLDRNKLGNQDSDSQNSDKTPPKKSTGRKPADAKEHLVSDTIEVFPQGVERDRCIHHRIQSAWRIVDGKAVNLRYDIDTTFATCPIQPACRCRRASATVAANSGWK